MTQATGEQQTQGIEQDETATSEVNLLDVLLVLVERRRFILFFTLGVALLTVVVILLIPSRYTAETVVLPPGLSSSPNSALLGQLGGSGSLASAASASLGIKNPGDMYVALFLSRTVEDSVIQRFRLTERYGAKKLSDTQRLFESRSSVVLGTKDGLIRVGVSDRDPKFAAELANGYVDEFRKFSSTLAITEASQRRVFFQQQLREANENLAAAEESMKNSEQSTGVLQVDSQAKSLIESAEALRAEVVAKQVQLQGMRTYATEENPDMVVAKQQLAELEAQLSKLSGRDQDAASSIIMRKGNIPEAGMEYVRKLRDVKYYEAIADLIAKQLEIAKLDEARQGAVIQVVDQAIPPDARSFPRRSASVLIAILGGFFAACIWCLLQREWRRLRGAPEDRRRFEALRAAAQN